MVGKNAWALIRRNRSRFFRAWRWERFVAREYRRIASKGREGSDIGWHLLVQVHRQRAESRLQSVTVLEGSTPSEVVGSFEVFEALPPQEYSIGLFRFGEGESRGSFSSYYGVSKTIGDSLLQGILGDGTESSLEVLLFWEYCTGKYL